MPCLCGKLAAKQYDKITPSEAAILRRAWVEAPELRKLERNLQLNQGVEGLVATYNSTYLTVIQQGGKRPQNSSIGRAIYYALAEQIERNSAIDATKSKFEDALHTENIEKHTLYENRRIGNIWCGIIEDFSSVANRCGGLLLAPRQFEGLMCLLKYPSRWERASNEERVAALNRLVAGTAIVNNALLARPVVEEAVRAVRPKAVHQRSAAIRPRDVIRRTMHTQPIRPHPCITNSIQAMRVADHSVGSGCDDSVIVLILLSFLSPSHSVPVDLLVRGASTRKRWTSEGEPDDIDAIDAGLTPALCELLSNTSRLQNALNNAPAVLERISSDYYMINESTVRHFHLLLPHDCLDFWKCQALIVTYRAIPWKYLEPRIPDPRTYLVHLEHTLAAVDHRFELLSAHMRRDLTLSLIEAVRFRKKNWKQFAFRQAVSCADGVGDGAARVGVAYSMALIKRLLDRTVVDITDELGQIRERLQIRGIALDNRTHASFGHATIQLALNDMQKEKLTDAEQRLLNFNQLGEVQSSMEAIVAVRRAMLLGRIYRWQGKFSTSIDQVQTALTTTQQYTSLHFEEDLSELCCDLADSLRDDGQFISAEQLLRDEIKRYNPGSIPSSLVLSLAEVLFAQGRYEEVKQRCSEVSKSQWVSNIEKLRLSIIQAKTSHMLHHMKDAQSFWLQALKAVENFERTNGHTTRIIILSMSKTLRPIEDSDYLKKSLQQLQELERIEEPGSVNYWIAGMKDWEIFMKPKPHSRF